MVWPMLSLCVPEIRMKTDAFCDRWKEMGVIAIGWAGTGDLTGMDQQAIRQAINRNYTYNMSELSKSLFACDMLVNRMQVGDYVLVPDPDELKKIYCFSAGRRLLL